MTALVGTVVIDGVEKTVNNPAELAPRIIETIEAKVSVEVFDVMIIKDGLGSVVENFLRDLERIKEAKRARDVELEAFVINGHARKLKE